jgi:hypothetical protein
MNIKNTSKHKKANMLFEQLNYNFHQIIQQFFFKRLYLKHEFLKAIANFVEK